MKKFFTFLLVLLLLLGGFAGIAWYILNYQPDWLPQGIAPQEEHTQEDAEDSTLNKEQSEKIISVEEQELIDLLGAYEDRKNEITYLHMLALELLERRQVKKAENYLAEALALDSTNIVTRSLQAKALLLQNKVGEARAILDQLPDDYSDASFTKALAAILEHDRDEAGRQFHGILENNPDGKYSDSAQKIIDAYREFDFFRDGQTIHLTTLLARSMSQIHEPQLAIWLLRGVLDEKTDYRDAWILLGYAYFDLQQFRQSEDAFQKAYALDSEKPETQYFLGLTYYALEDFVESERFLEYAIINGFEPKVQAYEKLSEVYLENERYEKAVKMYENYLALLPETTARSFIVPVSLYIEELENPVQALRITQQVAEVHSDDAVAHSLLAWAQASSGNYRGALDLLSLAEELGNDASFVALSYGRIYEIQGNLEKAKDAYKEAYSLGKGKDDGNRAAQLYNALIDPDTDET